MAEHRATDHRQAAHRPAAPEQDSVPAAVGDLVLGTERRYNAPLLTPGTRLVLPAGLKAVPVLDYYRRPRLGPAASMSLLRCWARPFC